MIQLAHDLENFILKLYDESSGGFRFTPHGDVTLLSTCFGVQLCYLIGRIDLMDERKVGAFIRNQQQITGEFLDHQFDGADLQGRQNEQYLLWQFSFFSLTALDMLGQIPDHDLQFLDEYLSVETVERWLSGVDFKDFWYGSNEIMFLLFFLSYAMKYERKCEKCLRSVNYILSCLDSMQGKNDGFWGESGSTDLANRMFGAAHIYLFYQFFNKIPGYVPTIVEKTLSLQVSNGLYDSYVGGACEDYDGVEILGRMMRWGGDKEQIRCSMERSYRTILKAQNSNGGFPYRISSAKPGIIVRRIVEKIKGEENYRYSGWSKMESNSYTPDLWATYFRMLSIANIEIAGNLPLQFPYVSYDLPAWGYLFTGPFFQE